MSLLNAFTMSANLRTETLRAADAAWAAET
jgi:hypothetical protein